MTKTMYRSALLLTPILLLAACSSTNQPTPNQTSHIQAEISTGIWNVEGCRIQAKRAGITIMSDTSLSASNMYMKIISDEHLTTFPEIKLNALPKYRIVLDGRDRYYGFDVPYAPAAVARFIHPNSFIEVTYTPESQQTTQKALFSTSGLAEAVVKASKNC